MSVGLGVFEFGGGGVVLLEVGIKCTAVRLLELILLRFEVTLSLLLFVGRLLSTLELLLLTIIILLIVRTASVVIIRPFRTMEVPLALGDGSGG